MLPIMTVEAPAASALEMSPEKRMPPSAMHGTPVPSSASATFEMAVICGTPTPATMRVVQIEPGPMPTLTASAPCFDQRQGGRCGGDVAADDVHVRVTWS